MFVFLTETSLIYHCIQYCMICRGFICLLQVIKWTELSQLHLLFLYRFIIFPIHSSVINITVVYSSKFHDWCVKNYFLFVSSHPSVVLIRLGFCRGRGRKWWSQEFSLLKKIHTDECTLIENKSYSNPWFWFLRRQVWDCIGSQLCLLIVLGSRAARTTEIHRHSGLLELWYAGFWVHNRFPTLPSQLATSTMVIQTYLVTWSSYYR